jgi:hypothetical protein
VWWEVGGLSLAREELVLPDLEVAGEDLLGELGEGGEFVFDDCCDRGVDVVDAGVGFGDDLGGG